MQFSPIKSQKGTKIHRQILGVNTANVTIDTAIERIKCYISKFEKIPVIFFIETCLKFQQKHFIGNQINKI